MWHSDHQMRKLWRIFANVFCHWHNANRKMSCLCEHTSRGAFSLRGNCCGLLPQFALQGKPWWRQWPHMTALIALALLGSAGLAGTWGGPLGRRHTLAKHKHLMSQVSSFTQLTALQKDGEVIWYRT